MIPIEHAALSTLNIGRTLPIMTSNPPPSSPSIDENGTRAPSAVTGAESLPQRPRPSNDPWTRIPTVFEGTSKSVLSPPPSRSGRDDHTYAVALDADVTQLLRASRHTSSPARLAVLTGAQKWLR